jgi:hypothetical protein
MRILAYSILALLFHTYFNPLAHSLTHSFTHHVLYRYEDVLRHFPAVDFAFAYGSGAVRQAGYRYEEGGEMPMLDVIFAVQDPLKVCE